VRGTRGPAVTGTIGFLSPEWLARALELTRDHQAAWTAELNVSFVHTVPDGGTVEHHQTWAEGRLQAWTRDRGSHHAPQATIACPQDALLSWLSGDEVDDRRLAVRDSGDRVWSLPLTSRDLSRTARERKTTGCSLGVRVRFPDHPFGPTDSSYDWSDGILRDDEPAAEAERDLELSLPFPEGVGYLLGLVPFRVIAGAVGMTTSDIFALAALTGLLAPSRSAATDEDAHTVCTGATALAALGELRSVLVPLMNATAPSPSRFGRHE
jgi:hypothetical protein